MKEIYIISLKIKTKPWKDINKRFSLQDGGINGERNDIS